MEKERTMNRCWFLSLAACLVALAPALADDKDKEKADEGKIKEKLLGTWKFVEGERGGEAPPEDFARSFKLEFKKEGKFTVTLPNTELEGDFVIDVKPKLWEIEFKLQEGDRKAIFKLDGEKLKLCVSEPGGERPTEFASKEGSLNMYFVMEREKKEKDKPPG
jgi:uncharacterized protein (TIGR03067 family)